MVTLRWIQDAGTQAPGDMGTQPPGSTQGHGDPGTRGPKAVTWDRNASTYKRSEMMKKPKLMSM